MDTGHQKLVDAGGGLWGVEVGTWYVTKSVNLHDSMTVITKDRKNDHVDLRKPTHIYHYTEKNHLNLTRNMETGMQDIVPNFYQTTLSFPKETKRYRFPVARLHQLMCR